MSRKANAQIGKPKRPKRAIDGRTITCSKRKFLDMVEQVVWYASVQTYCMDKGREHIIVHKGQCEEIEKYCKQAFGFNLKKLVEGELGNVL